MTRAFQRVIRRAGCFRSRAASSPHRAAATGSAPSPDRFQFGVRARGPGPTMHAHRSKSSSLVTRTRRGGATAHPRRHTEPHGGACHMAGPSARAGSWASFGGSVGAVERMGAGAVLGRSPRSSCWLECSQPWSCCSPDLLGLPTGLGPRRSRPYPNRRHDAASDGVVDAHLRGHRIRDHPGRAPARQAGRCPRGSSARSCAPRSQRLRSASSSPRSPSP